MVPSPKTKLPEVVVCPSLLAVVYNRAKYLSEAKRKGSL
jgi:hypothetical protein